MKKSVFTMNPSDFTIKMSDYPRNLSEQTIKQFVLIIQSVRFLIKSTWFLNIT